MRKRSRTTDEWLKKRISFLYAAGRDKKAAIWSDLASRLSSSRRNRTKINVSRLGRYTKGGDIVAVPGKVLGAGAIGHAVTVAAFSFSGSARDKVTRAGGTCLSFEELVEKNPKGTNVKIMRGI